MSISVPDASTGGGAPATPAKPTVSEFEKVVTKAWQSRRPVMLLFPGNEPFDQAKCDAAWKAIPESYAPEHLVLTPGSAEGSIGGQPVNWEDFFDIGGHYPSAVMILPESGEGAESPKVADMTYRVIARQQGDITPENAATLARRWMFEDFDAVMMRAWVLGKPLLMVFPHPENERMLLESPELAELEERVAVFVNTKRSVSSIRRKTAAQMEKDFATEGVERSEIALYKLSTKSADPGFVRLDQIQLNSVNRAFAKTGSDKILSWITSRVAKPEPKKAGK